MENLKIIEINSELGAGIPGVSLGVGAIKAASLNKGSDFFRNYQISVIPTHNESLFEKIDTPYAKHIHEIRLMVEKTCKEVSANVGNGYFVIMLAGDHSTAAGTISGIKNAYPDKRIGVIWIDAHADLHSPYTTPSGNLHGCPLAIVAAEDNLDSRINHPNQATIKEWEAIKKVGFDGPKIQPSDVVFVSVRDMEKQERYLMEKYNIRNVGVQEVREKGVNKVADEILDHLNHCDLIYISFDVDSLDPDEISEGTGTPVPHGLFKEEAMQLNRLLVADAKVCAWEIVEINPTLDYHNAMANTAFDILESTAAAIETRLGLK